MADVKKRIRLWVVLPITVEDVKCQCILDGSLCMKCLFIEKRDAIEYRDKTVHPTILASITVTEEQVPPEFTKKNVSE